ncbi:MULTISPECIES: serine hydroxymethyltransferase [unclassified Micromonospora]|uniref:serine hydroxymethyltransferase n=1 Tax=unclassified Micromonospora TaxID=2617518 RepID=UPI001C21AF03|nr:MULTISPECIES: serine hydroxymethyltransferase [unclassified Micromonospora]MBU8860442.1 serine hydroxymethyltransferase [Micromonospora sp. WMMB482]MDM4779979.1 serine hydroxymethyltransferase [Micromonospora sp. b486]
MVAARRRGLAVDAVTSEALTGAPETGTTDRIAALSAVAAAGGEGFARLAAADPALVALAHRHRERRCRQLNLVAAASPTLPAVLAAGALGFGAVTAEGYPGQRYHSGAETVDAVERLARARAELLFGAAHANVQPASGSAANLAVLYGLLGPDDTVLSLELSHGGHLSHVSGAASVSRRVRARHYRVGPDGLVDTDAVAALVREVRPRLLICGGSACPRAVDFAAFRRAADETGALLMADVSHVSGLVATGLHPSPFDHCDVVTTSTYKQLRGPRGGLALLGARSRIRAADLDRAVFPGFQGTPDFGAIAGKAVALRHAARPAFAAAMGRMVRYAGLLADALTGRGVPVLTGGTDTHMVLVDLRHAPVSGRYVCDVLEAHGVLANRNPVPDDPRPVGQTSGLRFGTNDLAFRDVGDDLVTTVVAALAGAVAELAETGDQARCPSLAVLPGLVAEVASRGYREG